MNKKSATLLGLILIAIGFLSITFTAGVPLLGLRTWSVFEVWRYWPLTVIGVGVGMVLPPLLYPGRRGLGGMFIPGIPILVNGGMLLFSSVLDWWHLWSWIWPLEVLGLAAGFALAALWMRVIWLLIPAIILGANGLLFQFCAITGLWEVWAVMWSIEPLSVGLALLLIGARKRRHRLMLASLILCGIGGVGLVGMTALLSTTWVLSGWMWAFRMTGPAILIVVGLLLLLWSAARRTAPFKIR